MLFSPFERQRPESQRSPSLEVVEPKCELTALPVSLTSILDLDSDVIMSTVERPYASVSVFLTSSSLGKYNKPKLPKPHCHLGAMHVYTLLRNMRKAHNMRKALF